MRKARRLLGKSGMTLDELGVKMGYETGTARRAVWQLLNKKLIRTFNFGNRVFLDNVIFLLGQSRIALVKVRDIKKIRYKGRWETK